MLKHVQISPVRNRSDSVSLRFFSHTISCGSSMCDSPEPAVDLQRTPSRASSYISLNEQLPQTTIKVYTNCLKIDIEYKTLGIQWDASSKEVIAQLLRRLKMRHRDPRLFYLSMEVAVRRAGLKTILVLDDETRPAIMQACHPKGESRFCLQLKPGGLIRVHTSALQPNSQYKSLVISEETTSDDLIQLLLGFYNSPDPVEKYSLYEVCPGQECQRKLYPGDFPLRAQAERMMHGEVCHFLVRRKPNYARRRQLLANLNEAIIQAKEVVENTSLLELSIESELSLSEDSCSSRDSSEDVEDGCGSSSGSSDNSTECALRRVFYPRAMPPTTPVFSQVSDSPARPYSPVYNIREIRTASYSFSSLGKDKKLLDIHMNSKYAPAGVCKRLLSMAETKTQAENDHQIVKITPEAVNNNPAKGLGHFIYL
ncbi:hypothetical protein KR009_000640 [Drosophila setifemur]|nr:hypothetical protein KR009_000640 [Drosophila setifemur]